MTLALANPFLWYLIDRSKPGFLLSAAVGLTGSALMMGIDPAIMPTPHPSSGVRAASAWNTSTPSPADGGDMGGIAGNEMVETGIWMLSVLFCSCVCFGNIGRRLELNRKATGRGRWAGV